MFYKVNQQGPTQSFSSGRILLQSKMAMMGGAEFGIEPPKAPEEQAAEQQTVAAGVGAPTEGDTPAETVTGQKRSAEENLNSDNQKRSREDSPSEAGISEAGNNTPSALPTHDEDGKPLSKNQLKRLKRQQRWEEKKEDRKSKRKDKRHALQARKRDELQSKLEAAKAEGRDAAEVIREHQSKPPKRTENPVPVSFILDCGFEEYMRDGEKVSLSSQVVRSYAMTRMAKYQAHLFVSGYGGTLKERFEGVLNNNHKGWKGAMVLEGDFLEAAKKANEVMKGPGAGKIQGALANQEGVKEEEGEEGVDRSVVYLTSDSPYTLERLEPYTSYVIGGIVDRNREKGLCYNKAVEHKVRTAKLPIGEYMAMQSRFVLTTNQVVEIMDKWLECGDWSEAFLHVIPPRKGAVVKNNGEIKQEQNEDPQDVEDAREQAAAEQEKADDVAKETEEKHVTGADEALEATGAFTADEETVVSQTGGGAVPATQEGTNQQTV
ncbi:tRNA (guanine(9)-N(1))-methyltransferase [Coniochaeta pulveracea]|uniref:tRNA (guanine(9)-N1)-methyltransferase n=1 Tax=Coniochaeta pulveracea TaxID=177199 RepID=A0A420YCD4_9PEZI|nr:tRNA (guanine(9)-N(1))-methyltransferase [Coniochaeta pulveracea]